MASFDSEGRLSDRAYPDAQIEELTRRVAALEKTVAAMRALNEDFWGGEAAALLVGAGVTSWEFEARDKNILFPELFPAEINEDGSARCWVKKSGELSATIAVNRANPLVFSIEIVGFIVPELADTLRLEIDGARVAWSVHNGKLWSAPIAARKGHAQVRFRVFVDSKLIPADNDVSFSIAALHIVPAGQPVAADTARSDRLVHSEE